MFAVFISALFVLSTLGLIITHSLYIEFDEIIIIVITLTFLSTIIVRYFFKKVNNQENTIQILGYLIAAFITSIGYWFLSIGDIIIDNQTIQGFSSAEHDGRPLTLVETLSEFSDELFVLFIMMVPLVLLVSFIVNTRVLKIKTKGQ